MAGLESKNKDLHYKKKVSHRTQKKLKLPLYILKNCEIYMVNHSDFISFMTHRKNNLYPAWLDSSYLL